MPSFLVVPIELTDVERERLESWSRRHTSAQALAQRSRIVLLCAEGRRTSEICRELRVHRNTIAKWRDRFLTERLEGLLDEPRPGQITDAKVEEVIVKTLESTPRDATHWSTRSMAKEVGLNQSAVHRIWRAFGEGVRGSTRYRPGIVAEPTLIPVEILLGGQPVVCETRAGVFSPYVVVLDTTLPDQAVELHSTYLGHEQARTQATHLLLALGLRETLAVEHDHDAIPVLYERQRCLYDHMARLQDLLQRLDLSAQIGLGDDALAAIAR